MSAPCTALAPGQLRLSIRPESLGFDDTRALVAEPLPWIGQQRAFDAARFGLTMQQPDYHLFVLGEVGSSIWPCATSVRSGPCPSGIGRLR